MTRGQAFVSRIDYKSIQAESIDVRIAEGRAKSRATDKMKRQEVLENKGFVVWDGEGADSDKRKAQDFILFGSFNGSEHRYITGESLGTFQCLDHIIKVGRENPNSWHVSFAFGYDVNMILKTLSVKQFQYLRDHGKMRIGQGYRIEHMPSKWFQVTKYHSEDRRTTVRIYDVFGFYQCSFVKALKDNIPTHPLMVQLDVIEAGKKKRGTFTYEDLDYVANYWKVEQTLFHALVNHLREMVYAAGLYIGKWHGPGELADYLYRQNGVKGHKCETDDRIYELSRYAYCGGRFERFHIGRFRRVFGYDINSAYPDAISRLPSLQTGRWNYHANVGPVAEFGLYRVHLRVKERQSPGPLFRRDSRGNITFPWQLDGWYWGPEILAMLKHYPHLRDSIEEAWIYEDDGSRPFLFVRELFDKRRRWKAEGNGAQMALKLALNSLYGKMAQRKGWKRTGKAPTWHQLEWAGWVTSYTRAKLFDLMCRMPYDKLIAVETDGIYTTATPDELGIEDSKELGGWEVSYYDEVIYLQSGVYAKRQGDEWSMKYRGLDKDTVTPEKMVSHCRLLVGYPSALCGVPIREYKTTDGHVWAREYSKYPKDLWPKLAGETTRFIGYENALFRETQNRGPFRVHHCRWETAPHEIDCERGAKRVHKISACRACDLSLNSYDMPHDTVIHNQIMARQKNAPPIFDLQSYPHDIPWIDKDDPNAWVYEWRIYEEEQEGLIRES